MSNTFRLKDKTKQAKYEELFDNFAEVLNKACEEQWGDSTDYIIVCRESAGIDHYQVRFKKKDILRMEKLYLYKWYPPSMFDGNPEGYVLVEVVDGERFCFSSEGSANLNELHSKCKKFMYVHQPKDE